MNVRLITLTTSNGPALVSIDDIVLVRPAVLHLTGTVTEILLRHGGSFHVAEAVDKVGDRIRSVLMEAAS